MTSSHAKRNVLKHRAAIIAGDIPPSTSSTPEQESQLAENHEDSFSFGFNRAQTPKHRPFAQEIPSLKTANRFIVLEPDDEDKEEPEKNMQLFIDDEVPVPNNLDDEIASEKTESDDADQYKHDIPPTFERRHSTRSRPPIVRFDPSTDNTILDAMVAVGCKQSLSIATSTDDELAEKAIVTALTAKNDWSKATKSDKFPRPPLLGVMACNIPPVKSLSQAALNGPYAGHWLDALKEEHGNLIKFGTYRPVKLPNGRRAIGSTYAFAVKNNKDGTVDKFKVRICVQGFSQRAGVDYSETFSPVCHLESVRSILAISAQYELKLRHADVVGAFLQGNLDEEVYMKPPKGLPFFSCDDRVWLLLKSLYGLKQTGRVWNRRLHHFLVTQCKFDRTGADPCVYTRRDGSTVILIGLHVDDMVIAHNDDDACNALMTMLAGEFEI